MQKRNAALCTWIGLLLVACAAPAAQVDVAAEEQAVRAVSMQWLELENGKDAAGIAALFADDGVVYRDATEPAVGAAAIQAYLTADWAENPNQAVTWTTDRVEVSSNGEMAVEHGTWTATDGASGAEQDRGKFLTVYRKVAGAWKVAADMSVSTRPEATPTTTTTM